MSPTSPGLIGFILNPRLLLSLALTIFLVLLLFTLWSHYPNPGRGSHYRYVSVKSVGASSHDLSTHSYAIVIDAGSSSSKVHLFHWPPHNGDPHKLLTIYPLTDELGDSLSKKVEPGISTFASTPEAAFNSLIPLLAFASDNIPLDKHPQTVLYILGTAGMRLLSKTDQERIISHLYTALPLEFPFHLPKDGIKVIPGKLEGVFSWITINYLLGHFSPESHTHKVASAGDNQSEEETVHTVGAVDMGGASLQIAFEVPQQVDITGLSDNMVEINLGCGIHNNQHKHRVYSKTYLGYGTNKARSLYYNMMVEQHLKDSSHNHSSSSSSLSHPSLKDPCTQLDLVENITLENKFSFKFKGLGDFTACKKSLRSLLVTELQNGTRASSLGKSTPCSHNDCGEKRDGFEKPPANLQYTSMNFYGTSEFWYTMRDVLRMGGTYSAGEFQKKSAEFCRTDWRLVRDRFTKKLYTHADIFRLRSQCLKSAWLSLILHEGLEFPSNSISLHTASSISGQSVQWPLGALLYYTRYLPLREVQIQQQQHLKSTQASRWDHRWLTRSSLTLPLLVVLSVIILLVVCRHRRKNSPLFSPGSNFRLPRSFSHASVLKGHRRGSLSNQLTNSLQGPVLTRNQSNVMLTGLA